MSIQKQSFISQKFWLEYYLDLLYSLIDEDVLQALVTIAEASRRLGCDDEFIAQKLLDRQIMRQIVRLVKHKNLRIQGNAAMLLSNCFATDNEEIRENYLRLCTFETEYNVIDVTLKAIYNLLNDRQFNRLNEGEYRVCRSLLCIIGNYVISESKQQWNLDLKKRFDLIDRNNDGHISLEDFARFARINRPNSTDKQIEEIFAKIDIEKKNSVTLVQFQKYFTFLRKRRDEESKKASKDFTFFRKLVLEHPMNYIYFMMNVLKRERVLIMDNDEMDAPKFCNLYIDFFSAN